MKGFLLINLIILSFSVSAQVTLSLSPENVQSDVDPMQFETVAHSILTNTADSTKTFRWFRVVESITMGWASAICDKNACYATSVDSTTSETDLVLNAGDSTNIDVHIRPAGIEGSAKIKVRIEEVGNPSNFIEGSYSFNQLSPAVDQALDELRIFPNPASSYFELSYSKNIAHITLFSLVGRQLKTFHPYPGEKYYIGDLDKGMYLVRIVNRRNEIVKTLRLNKR